MLSYVRAYFNGQVSQRGYSLLPFSSNIFIHYCSSSGKTIDVDRVIRIFNDHPYPDQPLQPTLVKCIPPTALSASLVELVLGRLFAAHSNGLKACEFFKYCLHKSQSCLTSDALEKTLHILTRMRYFDKAWALLMEIRETCPALLSLKSMSIMLSKIAKYQSYEDTLEAFKKMDTDIFAGRGFGVDEFNVLLHAFCTQRQMKEAKSVFQKMHSRFSPNTKTMNILLLGFKESGDVTAVELFYHEMVKRGFKPNNVTYNIRIDAYCKKGCFGDGLRLLEELDRSNCLPTLETITTLIHGAGVVQNLSKARQLFDEIPLRNLHPDTGAYNALISAFIRSKDINSSIALMDEMEKSNVEQDSTTYHTMFLGVMRSYGVEGVCELYHKMTLRNFVPKTQTVVMLMKIFCQNHRVDLGLSLWTYLLQKGYCPHSHALDLLVTGLCSRGFLQEAYDCSKQMLERGRHVSEASFLMLERFLAQTGEVDKTKELDKMIKKLQAVVLPSKGHALDLSTSKSIAIWELNLGENEFLKLDLAKSPCHLQEQVSAIDITDAGVLVS